jgi:soluble cytochrome b562
MGTNTELADVIVKQQQEISELKAQISLIKRHADSLMDSNSGIDYSGKMDGLLDAIDKAHTVANNG